MPEPTDEELVDQDLATTLDLQADLTRMRKKFYKLNLSAELIDTELMRLKAILETAEADLVARRGTETLDQFLEQKLRIPSA